MGFPAPEYAWFFDGVEQNVKRTPTLSFDATPESRGTYSCTATNTEGRAFSDDAFVTLNGTALLLFEMCLFKA